MKKRSNMIFITNRRACRLLWFTVGQIVQLIFHGLFFNWWQSYQIPLCIAAGILVWAFFFAGSWVTAREREAANTTHWEDMQ